MLFEFVCFLVVDFQLVSTKDFVCLEMKSDLQEYQDFSRCFPDSGKWHLMYGNYFLEPDLGGAAKCVSYESYGSYQNFSTPGVFSFQDGSTRGQLTFDYAPSFTFRNRATFVPYNDSAPREAFYAIYADCTNCAISQHYYGDNGHGCTYWRHADNMDKPAKCCDRIFDRYCGTVPKHQMYDASCESND